MKKPKYSKAIICGIYKITSPSNKIYVGQSVNIYKRWRRYFNGDSVDQTKLHRSFLKHGVNNHMFEVIQECKREELNDLEIYYIEQYKCFNSDNGLNLMAGGLMHTPSVETKKRIGDALRGKKLSKEHIDKLRAYQKNRTPEHLKNMSVGAMGKKVSAETKLKLSLLNSGSNHPKFGKQHSAETRKKISEANKGKVRTEEMRRNISIYNSGKKRSDEFKRKVSETHAGNKYNLGRILSDEHRSNIGNSLKKRVYQIDIVSGCLIGDFDCITTASKSSKVYYKIIRDCCKGRRHSCGRFMWSYREE